ncbi:hypothetical protein Poli38472_006676 [Pythium oligandrum]|uniref:Lysosomal dipeptide transporter MFSD1 n=1 Tax=Pythium oligandrum TaxID=41045 RepID=A0A8K1C578_PYTOL|nr:hypothetical protein Poli38472_006676 [Pythium oligandrum]|eukprot:TMW56666.1 hypothetical protein Poli38472_006676 [Pythium oligandrum]
MTEKSQQRVRWLVLCLSCVLMIGNYYCFDNPAALKSQLQQRFNKYPKQRFEFLFNLLYTLYSVPNVVLPFFGGVLVDRFGARVMLVVFSVAILVGQVVFAAGCSFSSFNAMLFGRVLFGFGGESLGVAQGTLVAAWFKNSELALALGINLSVARLGSVINNEVSPVVAEHTSVSSALWFGVFMCVVSFAAVLFLIPIDKRASRTEPREQNTNADADADAQGISFRDFRRFRPAFWLLALSCLVVYGCVIPFNNVASSLLMERDFFKEPPRVCQRCGVGAYAGLDDCPTIAIGCPPVPPYAWPLPKLSENCTIKVPEDQHHCSKTPPFIEDGKINCDDPAWKDGPYTKMYCSKKAEAAQKAATPMSIPYIISAVISPFLGFVVDRIGLRAFLALVAPLALTAVHVMLGLTDVNLYVPLVLQGVAYSVFAAALWPSVPYVVEPQFVGSAYGAITSIQNIGLALFPLAVAAEYNRDERYIPGVEMLFVSFGIMGSVVGIALNLLDYQSGSILNGTHRRDNGRKQKEEEATTMAEKSQLRVRWLVLCLACGLIIGDSYCFDNPAALKSQLQQRFNQYPKSRFEVLFNLLYTVYSVPNVVLPFFGGMLVDRFGARVMLVVFSLAVLIGQIVFAAGSTLLSFHTMLVGRVLFGFGGESLTVAQGTLVAEWFKDSELALALAFTISLSGLGSVINNEVSPVVAEHTSVSSALWFGVFMCVVSFAAVLFLIPIDKRASRTEPREQNTNADADADAQGISFRDFRRFRPAFWLLALSCLVVYGCVIPFNNVASSLLMERDFFKEPPRVCQRCGVGAYAGLDDCPTIAIGCPPVPPYAWPLPKLSENCTIKVPEDQHHCSKTPPFIEDGKINCDDPAWKDGPYTKMYCSKKAEAAQKAATPMSIPYIISAVISPFLGFVVDRIGLRAFLALVAPLALTAVHVMLGLTDVNLYVPLVLQGVAYSVVGGALWPSVPYAVKPKFVGSAYGAITSLQNIGLSLFPLIVAAEYDRDERYIPNVEVLFVMIGILGSVVGLALNLVDYQNGSILNRSPRKQDANGSGMDEVSVLSKQPLLD